jgi:hypothetical protein
MTYIVTEIWQAGLGPYMASFTPITEAGCREVMGYLFLNTPPDQDLILDQFKVKVFIRDRQGNHSRSINVPLRFGREPSPLPPEPWQAATIKSLGAIQARIMSSQHNQAGGGR